MKTVHVTILLIVSLSRIEALDGIFRRISKAKRIYNKACDQIKSEKDASQQKLLCAFELFDGRSETPKETPKCLLCPTLCNSVSIVDAPDVAPRTTKTFDQLNSSRKKIVAMTSDICSMINKGGKSRCACTKSLISDDTNRINLFVYNLCRECYHFKFARRSKNFGRCKFPSEKYKGKSER